MAEQPAIVAATDAVLSQPPPVRRFIVLGDEMRVKQDARSTGGRYAVMEQTLHPGGAVRRRMCTRARMRCFRL